MRHKFKLAVSIVFALVVAVSFTSMILSVAAAVNVLFGSATAVDKQITDLAEDLGNLPGPVRQALPFAQGNIQDNIHAFVHGLRERPMKALLAVCSVVLFLSVVAAGARFLQEFFAGAIGADISVTLAEEMYENIMGLSLDFFEERTSGDVLARFTNDIFMINRGLAGVFVKVLREPIKAVFFLGVALSVDPVLTAVGLCVLPLVGYIIVAVGKRYKKSVRKSLERIGSLATVANETFKGIAVVKAFCMEAYEIQRTRHELAGLRRHLEKMVRNDAAVGPLVEIVIVVGIVAFVLFSATRVLGESMSGGELVKLFSALALMLDPVRKLSVVNNMIQTSVASAERVFQFIDAKPTVTEKTDAVDIAPLTDRLTFDNVSFSYVKGAEILHSVSFEVRKGEMVALVGFSGAGKSTVVKLIPRFYDVTAGAICVDGRNISDASFRSLRGQISYVTQDTILFNESIRANIAFGQAVYSDERVRQAAQAARAAEFVEALPQGYDTIIGEGGANLSGGQRQRLAIARAIIKDPAILILDEATSSLDSESEQAIQRAIEEFVVGRTTIVIAHRLSTIQRADRIIVMDKGAIAQQGTHRELMQQDGIYRRLYEVQFGLSKEGAS
jgi:ATP-binding cassette, subfamily B, bacterial MsbA